MKNDDLWDGGRYRESSEPQESSATEIVDAIEFRGDEWVLDIGCGDGRITRRLCPLVPNGTVIGIDASPNMIHEARKDTATTGNVRFLEGGAEDFRLADRFDYIFSFHTLHWVGDKARVFRNIYDHLKPGGRFIFMTSGRGNAIIAGVFASERWRDRLSRHGSRFFSSDGDTIGSMLREAGLSVEGITVEHRSRLYADRAELKNWLMTWVPYATGLDSEDAVLFSEEIVDKMHTDSIDNGIGDGIEFRTEMLTVRAYR